MGQDGGQKGAVDRQEWSAQFYAALLEPGRGFGEQDDFHLAIRRLLIYNKALEGRLRRQGWKCNGVSYVAFREFLRQRKPGGAPPSQASSPISHDFRSASERERCNSCGCAACKLALQLRQPCVCCQKNGSMNMPSPTLSWPNSADLSPLFKRQGSMLQNGFPSRLGSFSSSTPPRGHSRQSSTSSDTSSLAAGGLKEEPAYSFVGMQCIFDDSKQAVNVVKFGRLSSEVLAYGGADGVLRVCTTADPPKLLQELKGHTKEITDFDWSLSNSYLCSASLDKSVRVWDVQKGQCVRIVYGSSAQLCCRFHPVNNNFILVGNAACEVSVVNFSTGRTVHKPLKLESAPLAMDVDTTGHIIYFGDREGVVHSVAVDAHSGALRHTHRAVHTKRSPITAIVYRTFSLVANGPVLLASTRDGAMRFFSVAAEVEGYLSLKCSMQLNPRARNIRASFCPLLSLDRGEFIVTGNEDASVYIYDFTRPGRACVNKLQGHMAPVIDVAWNFGENLLVSSDCEGVVIVWKRVKKQTPKDASSAPKRTSSELSS